jgi:hypothetical protein
LIDAGSAPKPRMSCYLFFWGIREAGETTATQRLLDEIAHKLRLGFPGAISHVINAPQAHKSGQLPDVDLRERCRVVVV